MLSKQLYLIYPIYQNTTLLTVNYFIYLLDTIFFEL
jgi:hypothetical protein